MSIINIADYSTLKKPNIKFTKESVTIEKLNERTGEVIPVDKVLIMIKNLSTGASLPHPLTEFLNKWKNCKFSTQERHAAEIVPFLNYILIDNYEVYNIGSLWDIDIEHGEDFLNELAIDKARNTVRQYESTLTEFYYFLAKKELLKNVTLDAFDIQTSVDKKGQVVTKINSPFYNIELPKKQSKSNLLHHLPKELIIPFLDTAIRYTPKIALGVYFQFFGGLRVGEVVNLTRDAITTKGSFGENGMILNIKKRNLRPDLLSNEGKGEVKRERYQIVIPIPRFSDELLKSHLNTYGYNLETGALFTNRDGLGMTERSYREQFGRLKAIFLKQLKHSGNSTLEGYGLTLASKKWSTHLGRGVFSNMIADIADNATQIALARGDKSLDSALSYLSDSSKIAGKVQENLNFMYRDLINM